MINVFFSDIAMSTEIDSFIQEQKAKLQKERRLDRDDRYDVRHPILPCIFRQLI